MGFVLKISYDGTMLRKRYANSSEVTLHEIGESVRSSFAVKDYIATYQDSSYCWRTLLTQSDLNGALADCSTKALLRLHITHSAEMGAAVGEGPLRSLVVDEQVDIECVSTAGLERPEVADGMPLTTAETLIAEGSPGEKVTDTQYEDQSFVIPENVPTYAMNTPIQSPRHQDSSELTVRDHSVTDLRDSLEELGSGEGPTSDCEDHELPFKQADEEDAGFTTREKVQLVLAAFDKDGDGRLSYVDCRSLQLATSSSQISKREFESLCHQLGQDESVGLDIDALLTVYEVFGTLDQDFDAAAKHLGEQQSVRGKDSVAIYFLPHVSLGVALAFGPAAGAVALAGASALLWRQRRRAMSMWM